MMARARVRARVGREWSPVEIVARLQHLRGNRTLEELATVIQRTTGRTVSFTHLSNIILGRKLPGKAVLEYLELERVVVYRERDNVPALERVMKKRQKRVFDKMYDREDRGR